MSFKKDDPLYDIDQYRYLSLRSRLRASLKGVPEVPFALPRLKDLSLNLKASESQENLNHGVPKVSIYIPAYNVQDYILEAIESVLLQSYQNLEVCICDDGSTDQTSEVIHRHYQHHSRVHYQRIENSGIGKASNVAISMCRGFYIGQLDADDTLKPHAVETMVKFMEANQHIACAYSAYESIDEKGKTLGLGYRWPLFSREKMLSTMIVHHFRFFKKDAWKHIGGFNESIKASVDYDFFLRMSLELPFYHLNKVLYRYRINPKSISHSHYQVQTQNQYQAVKRALSFYHLEEQWEPYIRFKHKKRNLWFRPLHYKKKKSPKRFLGHTFNRILFFRKLHFKFHERKNFYQLALFSKIKDFSFFIFK